MALVFISHIHEEEKVAQRVQAFLRSALREVAAPFLSSDKWAVYAGERWLDRIVTELREAIVVILMLSKLSVTRPWVNFEAGAAWIKDAVVIPVCFRGLEKGNLPKPYSNLEAIDLMSEDDQFFLANSVAHHLGSITLFPPWLARITCTSTTIPTSAREMAVKVVKDYDDLRVGLETAFRELDGE